MKSELHDKSCLKIGWAQADITPPMAVQICGQFHNRISEGIHDPLTVTVLALDGGDDHAVFVSCDIVMISDALQDRVRANLGEATGLDPQKVILNATHIHTGPEVMLDWQYWPFKDTPVFLGLNAMDVGEYVDMAAKRISAAVVSAWNSRTPGRMAFGMSYAVVGRNRRWTNTDGVSRMLGNTDDEKFSHIEGYEDHSVGVMAIRDEHGDMTGLVVNIACPSQVVGGDYEIGADFWHEARVELRKRFGEKLFILPQCSVAGDQCPHLLYDKKAHLRMLELAGRNEREEYGLRIASAVETTLNILGNHTDEAFPLKHHVETLQLPLARITKEHVDEALKEADVWQQNFDEKMQQLQADPSMKDQPRWYVPVSRAKNMATWFRTVAERYDRQEKGLDRTLPCELHVIRLGDVAIATNPFEYYLDYGIFIKARSRAVQTFLVQLAGTGTYVPSLRSTLGGGYGSTAASNPVGPEGGRMLAEHTIDCITKMWE